MKLFGGGGKHSGRSHSSYQSSTPRIDTASLPDVDEILAEEYASQRTPAQPVRPAQVQQKPTPAAEPLQEMREYIPGAAQSSAVRQSPPHITGYSTFEDDDTSVVPRTPAAPPPVRPAAVSQSTIRMPSASSEAFRPVTSSARPAASSSLGRAIDPQNVHTTSEVRGYVRPGSILAKQPVKAEKKKKRRRWPITLGATAVVLAALYCLCVFSNIPFIAKWRAIYIETAMGTMTHQWLATAFIPKSIIEDVMYERWKLEEGQAKIESDNSMVNPSATTMGALRTEAATTVPEPAATTAATTTATTAPPVPEWEKEDYPLYTAFPELDRESFIAYANEHAETLYTEDGHIMIDEAGRDQEGTSILTTNGDQVLALDTKNGILIIKVTGEESDEIYEGKLALIRDPAQVKLGVAKNLGSVGQQVGQIAERNGAILGINASGFQDDEGHGNGGVAYGFVMSDGKRLQSAIGGNYKVIAFDTNNILNITNYKSSLDLRDGAEFRPALIVNGKIQVSGSAGWGIHPRTVIGQAENGTVMMLVIDGRQTHSMGCTIGECAIILERYGAVQACNLDGGSSSVLYYNGRVISNPSGADKVNGRYLPDAFIVMPAAESSADGSAE